MKRFVAVAVALVSLAAGGSAVAQEPPQDQLPHAAYTFRDDVVESTLLRPELDQLYGLHHPPTTTLIKIRDTFVPEMLKSTESL